MKTKEFIEKANKLGYNVNKVGLGTKMFGKINRCTVALISEDYDNMVDLSYVHHMNDELFDLIVSYAKTPISERKSVKKYFIHVFRSQQDGYLTLVNDKAEFGSRLEATSFSIKTRFTKKEIRQLKKREDIPLDWDKVTLAEA